MPQATAAAAPPDDPPGVIFVFQGLRVMPRQQAVGRALDAEFGRVRLAEQQRTASRKRAVAGASTSHGCCGSTVRDPRNVGQPRVRIKSLIDTGTPSRRSCGARFRQRASDSPALASAASASTTQNALSLGSSSAIRASTDCIASTGDACPVR
jgi:hypothetical protein